jgi:cytochrome c-type biogenesis protein CcmH
LLDFGLDFIGFLIVVMSLGIPLAYYEWGAYAPWMLFEKNRAEQERAIAYLKTVPSIDVLIEQLKTKVEAHPTAKGYYLLGRLYESKGDSALAKQAFSKALTLGD